MNEKRTQLYLARCNEAWEDWLSDNRDRFPPDKLAFVKSAYTDGQHDAFHFARADNIKFELVAIAKKYGVFDDPDIQKILRELGLQD